MRTELIEKLKSLKKWMLLTKFTTEASIINEAIQALSKPKGVSDEEIKTILQKHKDKFKWGSDGDYITVYAIDEDCFNDVANEIIQALSETKGVSAEEVEKIALEKYPIEMVSIFTKMDFVDKNAERRIIFIEAYSQAMHDYAGQSDAEQLKEHAIRFADYIPNVNYWTNEELEDFYQQFLNREEK